jgi:anti-sigma regulatory factor (Ser/Thr protein kinase)
MSAGAAYCELSFSPNESLIATVRKFVGDFYVKVLGDENVTSRLVVASHELLENVVRYSADGESRIKVSVQSENSHFRIRIVTHNRGTPADVEAIRGLLAKFDPRANRKIVYRDLILGSAEREEGSGLGLGRVYAESEMDLSCKIELDTIELTAEGLFSREGRKHMPTITNIETPDLRTETTFGPGEVVVQMIGSAETGSMGPAAAFLKELHERVLAEKIPKVTIDMRTLDFMNSSCFKAFVGWLDRIKKAAPADRYRVRFLHDERKHWQARSLEALAAIAFDLIVVEF